MGQIEIDSVSKRFGTVEVLSDLSLSIADSEFVTFLGPSGCGKSTLLRMIAGLETVDSGRISIGGRRVDVLPPGQRGVAMVFQHYALYPHMTVADNVTFGLENIGTPPQERASRLAEAARMLEIEPLLDRRPAQLSGGQRQRVAIARALVKKPAAFLFDEPLSNLDAALRLRTRLELAQLHQRTRATTIFVTHDQVEAMTLADRIVVMHDRAIEQVGDPITVYVRPRTKFVAQFVGSPAMNVVPVRVARAPDGSVEITLDGRSVALDMPFAALPEGPFELGIRAEDLRVAADGDIEVTAEVVERLGDRTHVHARLADGTALVAEAGGLERVGPGDRVSLRMDVRRVHLFGPDGLAHRAEPRDASTAA